MLKAATQSDFAVARLLRKTLDHAGEHGIVYAFNRAVWKVHHARFERIKSRRTGQPRSIPYLGHEFELHPSRQGLSEEMALFGTHEPVGAQCYLEGLSPGDHVVDIGSNIGYWLLTAEQVIGDSGRVLGFEPVPDIFEILQRNIASSGRNNIQVLACAVGASNGTAQFYQSEVPNWGSLERQQGLKQARAIDVKVRRLEDVLREFPDFRPSALRMDLEGAELMVLESAASLLAEYHPALFVEFHPAVLGWPAIRKTLVWLHDLGYSSGTLIERTWDQPWIGKWMRDRRRWSGTIDVLLRRIEYPKDPLTESTFTLILKTAGS